MNKNSLFKTPWVIKLQNKPFEIEWIQKKVTKWGQFGEFKTKLNHKVGQLNWANSNHIFSTGEEKTNGYP